MSWELEYTLTAVCPCGKGKLIEKVYGDDWNRTEISRRINCEECSKKYHFESIDYYHSGELEESVYLVENGKTISVHVSIENYYEDIANHYTYKELQEVIEQLASISASKKAKGTLAEYAVHEHKRRYDSVKLYAVLQHTREAAERYYFYKYNKENMRNLEDECRKIDRFPVTFSR